MQLTLLEFSLIVLVSCYVVYNLFKSYIILIRNEILSKINTCSTDHKSINNDIQQIKDAVFSTKSDMTDIKFLQRVMADTSTGLLMNESASKILLFTFDKYICTLMFKMLLNKDKNLNYLGDIMKSECETISYKMTYMLKAFKIASNENYLSDFFAGDSSQKLFNKIADDLISDIKHYGDLDENRLRSYSNFRIKQLNHAFSIYLNDSRQNLNVQIVTKTFVIDNLNHY